MAAHHIGRLLAQQSVATSRAAVAARLGISQSALSHWITGARVPQLSYAAVLASVLGMDERDVRMQLADLKADGLPPRPVPPKPAAQPDVTSRLEAVEAELAALRAEREADKAAIEELCTVIDEVATKLERRKGRQKAVASKR